MGTPCTSLVIFLIVREPDAGSTPAYVESGPLITPPRRSDAGVRRSLREDACSECLHHFDFGTGTGPFGGSLRTCRQRHFQTGPLIFASAGERNSNSERSNTHDFGCDLAADIGSLPSAPRTAFDCYVVSFYASHRQFFCGSCPWRLR